MTQIDILSTLSVRIEDVILPKKRSKHKGKPQVKLVATYENDPTPGTIYVQQGDTIDFNLRIKGS